MGRFELEVLYARAMTKLWEKVEALRGVPDLRIADFGTRRRHSYPWQDWCVQALGEGLGNKFVGTSNCRIAMMRYIEAIGTNAHELPMVYAALAPYDAALARAPYDVMRDWQDEHDGNENTNGFLRQFIPKGTDLSDASQTWLNDVAALMNTRPRKTLGWKTPAEAMAEEIAAFKSNVALDVGIYGYSERFTKTNDAATPAALNHSNQYKLPPTGQGLI